MEVELWISYVKEFQMYIHVAVLDFDPKMTKMFTIYSLSQIRL